MVAVGIYNPSQNNEATSKSRMKLVFEKGNGTLPRDSQFICPHACLYVSSR